MERIKLKVVSVSEIKTLDSGKKLVNFSAVGPDGKGAQYTAWDEPLWAFLIKDAVLDAEVMAKETDRFETDGSKKIQRTLRNLYVQDKPVLQQQRQGGNYPREDPDMKRRSLALSYSKDMAIAGRLDAPGAKPATIEQILIVATRFDTFLQTGK